MVSGAGIMANLLIATGAFVIIKVFLHSNAFASIPEGFREPVELLLEYMLVMNISLAVFNLLPFPPLDGSKILETFLPASAQPFLAAMEQFGFFILMGLIYIGFFSAIMRPVMSFVDFLLYLGLER